MKKIICYLVSLVIAFSCISIFSCIPVSDDCENMVYSSPSEQDEIYSIIQSNEMQGYAKVLDSFGLTVVKESITPIYTVDMVEYAESGTLEIERLYGSYEGIDQYKAYIAKTINENGMFGGNFRFYIYKDKIHAAGFTPSRYVENYPYPITSYQASCSYADHAARIKKCLGKSELISAESIKYITINGTGGVFYVRDENNEYFFPIGTIDPSASVKFDVVLDQSEFKDLAQEHLRIYNEEKEYRERWEKDHPGEEYLVFGLGIPPNIAGVCSHVDNIIDIYEYLGIEKND